MQREFAFNICSTVILSILLFSLFSRNMKKGRTNRTFILLVVLTLLSSVSDVLRWVVPVGEFHSTFKKLFTYISHYTFFYSRNLTASVYLMYILSLSGLWLIIEKNKKIKFLLYVIPALIIITVTLNHFINIVFYLDEDLTYHRGKYILVTYFYSLLVVAISLVILIKYRYLFNRRDLLTILLIYPATLMAVLIQFLYPKYLVENIFTTFGIFAVSLIIHCPTENTNFSTDALGFNAYLQELERGFKLNIPANLIFLHIDNYKQLKRQFDVSNYNEMLKNLIKEIGNITVFDGINIYNLDNCNFVINCQQLELSLVTEIAEKIQNYLNNAYYKNLKLYLITTICIVKCPEEISDIDKIVSFSNNFFTTIEKKNEVTFLSEEAQTKNFKLRTEIDEIIKDAITEKKFEMYYQPIYSTKTGKFASAEALIRLKDENFGFISPALFIPAAEASGAIHQIGDFVIEDVCRFISSNNLENLGLEYVELNLSVAQCIEQNFAEKLIGALEKNAINPKNINLEITETASNFDQDTTFRNISVLSSYGLTFSLDDYGTGYSNIKRVTTMPLSIIKLDKTFVDEYERPDMRIVIKKTVDMFKKMNKHILVEGIEDKTALQHFTDIGCDYVQGFYFSKPLPETEFIKFLSDNNKKVL